MSKQAVTKTVYIGILLIALVAASFSARVSNTAWEILSRAMNKIVARHSPIYTSIASIMLALYVWLPVLSIIGTAFVVSYFSLRLLHRYSIGGQNSKRARVAFTYALASSLILLCCAPCSWIVYESVSFPSPAPYPGAVVEEIWKELGAGGYNTITYEYTIELPLNELEEHYIAEMRQYCVEGWVFTDTEIACTDYMRCRTARCEISRPMVELVKDAQFFTVYLRSVSETETNVLYFEKETDLG